MIEQIANSLGDLGSSVENLLRGDPTRIAFLRASWSGNLTLPNNTLVVIPTWTVEQNTSAVFGTANMVSQGAFDLQASGLLIAHFALRPAANYTGASGRIEIFSREYPSTTLGYLGTAPVVGDCVPGDIFASAHITIRTTARYAIELRWRQLVTGSFSVSNAFMTLIWLPLRY